MRIAGFIVLIALSFGVAGYAFVTYSFFPLGALLHPDMRATYALYPTAIYAHVFGSAVALIVGPFQFWSRLRNQHPQLHRWLGRIYLLVGVGIGGTAGLFMAFHAFGELPARLGFGCLTVLWLYTGYRAYRAGPHARPCIAPALDGAQFRADLCRRDAAPLSAGLRGFGRRL